MTTKLRRLVPLFQTVLTSVLVMIAASCLHGQFYLQGGITYWPEFESPSFTQSTFQSRAREHAEVDQNSDFWIGGGYKVTEEWSFEAFFSQLPSSTVSIVYYFPFQRSALRPSEVYYEIDTETTVFGVSASYEFSINDRLYLTGKAGLASSNQETTLVELLIPEFTVSDGFFDDNCFYDCDDQDYLDYFVAYDFFTEESSSVDLHFAVGVRIPIHETKASVTATYQFFRTSDTDQSGLYLGLRWDL